MSLLYPFLKAGHRLLDTLAPYSLGLAQVRSFLYFLRSERREPLLVYQMGKVGSSTLTASLRASSTVSERYSIYQVHRLTESGLELTERRSAEARARLKGTSHPKRRFHPEYARVGRWLQRRIGDPRNNRKWKVITLVRDPVSRNVSSFFQNLEFHLSYDYRSKVQYESRETMVADIRRLFEEHYLDREAVERIDIGPLTWFDSELKAVFDVDVYASEFPREQGYQIYESEKASVLLLRLEDLNRNHLTALKDFLRIKDFTLVTTNTAKGQAYSELYDAFLRDLTLPPAYVDELYGSKYARHFYSEEELRGFRSKWKTRASSAQTRSPRPAERVESSVGGS